MAESYYIYIYICIIFRVVDSWNSLPSDVVDTLSLQVFTLTGFAQSLKVFESLGKMG